MGLGLLYMIFYNCIWIFFFLYLFVSVALRWNKLKMNYDRYNSVGGVAVVYYRIRSKCDNWALIIYTPQIPRAQFSLAETKCLLVWPIISSLLWYFNSELINNFDLSIIPILFSRQRNFGSLFLLIFLQPIIEASISFK